jgi:hypothetical protein
MLTKMLTKHRSADPVTTARRLPDRSAIRLPS